MEDIKRNLQETNTNARERGEDIATFIKIQQGNIDWSGDVRSKRRTGKNIRRRS